MFRSVTQSLRVLTNRSGSSFLRHPSNDKSFSNISSSLSSSSTKQQSSNLFQSILIQSRSFAIMNRYQKRFEEMKQPKEQRQRERRQNEISPPKSTTTETTTATSTKSLDSSIDPANLAFEEQDKQIDSEILEKTKKPRKQLRITPPSRELMMGTVEIPDQPENPHILRVSLIGLPNAGKSSIVNQLVGDKVSIVSKKSQTTRDEVFGVYTTENKQVIFSDTPGVIKTEKAKQIQREVVTTAWNALDAADIVLVIIDAVKTIDNHFKQMMDRLRTIKQENPKVRLMLVLNKMDLSTDDYLADQKLNALLNENIFSEHFLVSALKGKGLEDLRDFLLGNTYPGNWEFKPTTTSDLSVLDTIQEVIREKIFERTNQEVPYTIKQKTIGWTPLKGGKIKIDQEIYAPKQSIVNMIIGKKGNLISWVLEQSRKELEKKLNIEIALYIHVKLSEKGKQ